MGNVCSTCFFYFSSTFDFDRSKVWEEAFARKWRNGREKEKEKEKEKDKDKDEGKENGGGTREMKGNEKRKRKGTRKGRQLIFRESSGPLTRLPLHNHSISFEYIFKRRDLRATVPCTVYRVPCTGCSTHGMRTSSSCVRVLCTVYVHVHVHVRILSVWLSCVYVAASRTSTSTHLFNDPSRLLSLSFPLLADVVSFPLYPRCPKLFSLRPKVWKNRRIKSHRAASSNLYARIRL